MSAQLHAVEDLRYMKGKSRHLFWPMLAFLLLCVLLQYAFNILVPMLFLSGSANVSTALSVAIAAVYALVLHGGWAALLAAYGAKAAVKTYKVVFIILACLQLLGLISLFLTSYNTMMTYMGERDYNAARTAVSLIAGLLGIVLALGWIVGSLVAAFSRKTGALLCVAAVLLALYTLAQTVYVFVSPYVTLSFYNGGMRTEIIGYIISAISIVSNLLYLATNTLFFAALSFGRQRQPKSIAPAAVPSQG